MSQFEILSLLIAIAGVLTAATGLAFVYLGLRANTQQLKATIFIEYSKRFNDILDDFGHDPLVLSAKSRLNKQEKQRLDTLYRRYLALLHQEHFLWWTGFIDANIWAIWINYTKIYLNSASFQSYWDRFRNSFFYSYRLFMQFVDELIGQINQSNRQLQPEFK